MPSISPQLSSDLKNDTRESILRDIETSPINDSFLEAIWLRISNYLNDLDKMDSTGMDREKECPPTIEMILTPIRKACSQPGIEVIKFYSRYFPLLGEVASEFCTDHSDKSLIEPALSAHKNCINSFSSYSDVLPTAFYRYFLQSFFFNRPSALEQLLTSEDGLYLKGWYAKNVTNSLPPLFARKYSCNSTSPDITVHLAKNVPIEVLKIACEVMQCGKQRFSNWLNLLHLSFPSSRYGNYSLQLYSNFTEYQSSNPPHNAIGYYAHSATSPEASSGMAFTYWNPLNLVEFNRVLIHELSHYFNLATRDFFYAENPNITGLNKNINEGLAEFLAANTYVTPLFSDTTPFLLKKVTSSAPLFNNYFNHGTAYALVILLLRKDPTFFSDLLTLDNDDFLQKWKKLTLSNADIRHLFQDIRLHQSNYPISDKDCTVVNFQPFEYSWNLSSHLYALIAGLATGGTAAGIDIAFANIANKWSCLKYLCKPAIVPLFNAFYNLYFSDAINSTLIEEYSPEFKFLFDYGINLLACIFSLLTERLGVRKGFFLFFLISNISLLFSEQMALHTLETMTNFLINVSASNLAYHGMKGINRKIFQCNKAKKAEDKPISTFFKSEHNHVDSSTVFRHCVHAQLK